MTEHDLKHHALRYAMQGVEVFPLNADKTPHTANGMKDASSDIIDVERWWNEHPDALIGARVPTDTIILDIDPRHGGDRVWHAIQEAYGPIEVARSHRSGRGDGGFHAWFKRPNIDRVSIKRLTEWAINNGEAHQLENDKLTCGIDLLTHGWRYTILPPSPHAASGKPYEWCHEANAGDMPGFLIDLLTPPPPEPPKPRQQSQADSIADWYSETARWHEILDGWTCVHGNGDDDGSLWRHPNATASWSASVKHGCLFVYTDNTPLEQTEEGDPAGHTRFKAYTLLHCNGNGSQAARNARTMRDGGKTPEPPPVDTYTEPEPDQPDPDAWPDPIPIQEGTRPPFPLHILPDWIADQVQQAAIEMQLTVDLAAQLAITALSIVAAKRAEIRVRGPWVEGLNTYLVTALPPSAGKSPTFSMMLDALDEWEEQLSLDGNKHAQDRELDRKHLEKLRDDALKKGELAQSKMYADDLRELPAIHEPRLMADDATPEKLTEILQQQNGRLALVSTEGGLFGMMTGRYSDKSNLDVYLGAWSGDTIRVDRVERGSLVVRNPRLSVGLTVQPSVISAIGANRELVGRGLTARFMYVIPADTVGNRSKTRDSTYDDAVHARYGARLLDIARSLPDLGDDPRLLHLSTDAARRFAEWQQGREEQLTPTGTMRYMAEWVAKCDSTTARLAGLLHLADGAPSNEVDVETLERALQVGDYWTEHAKVAFDLMGSSQDLEIARKILLWLEGRDTDRVTFSDISHVGNFKRMVDTTADLVSAVDVLIDAGWLRPGFDGELQYRVGRGRGPSPELLIHPSVGLTRLDPTDPTYSGTTQSVTKPPPSAFEKEGVKKGSELTRLDPTDPTTTQSVKNGDEIPQTAFESGQSGQSVLNTPENTFHSLSELASEDAPKPDPTDPTCQSEPIDLANPTQAQKDAGLAF